MPFSRILIGKFLGGFSLVTLPLPISMNVNIYQVQIKRTKPRLYSRDKVTILALQKV